LPHLKISSKYFGDLRIICDNKNKPIRWAYITALLDVQELAGFSAANKLSAKHVEYQKHIMKVKLTAQVLSSSVADALEFLHVYCHNFQQLDSEATVTFIRNIDHLFDLLNSHSPFPRGFKAAVRCENMCYWTQCISNLRDYISFLKTAVCRWNPSAES